MTLDSAVGRGALERDERDDLKMKEDERDDCKHV